MYRNVHTLGTVVVQWKTADPSRHLGNTASFLNHRNVAPWRPEQKAPRQPRGRGPPRREGPEMNQSLMLPRLVQQCVADGSRTWDA